MSLDTRDLESSIKVAIYAHSGEVDKGGEPYILHPLRIMGQMKTHTGKIVAVLHDVVGDSRFISIKDLEKAGYSNTVTEAVDALTRRKGEGYSDFIARVAANSLATEVKILDLEDNINILRLNELTSKDWERCRKYHQALQELKRAKGY